MNTDTQPLTETPQPATPTPSADPTVRYEAPRITTLGTLAQLTLGGNASGPSDAFGTAGASGVI